MHQIITMTRPNSNMYLALQIRYISSKYYDKSQIFSKQVFFYYKYIIVFSQYKIKLLQFR